MPSCEFFGGQPLTFSSYGKVMQLQTTITINKIVVLFLGN